MTENLINRITYHLSSGGLFNPELADHLAVMNLLMECREALAQPKQDPVAWLHRFIEGGISIGLKPADLKRHPERWEPLYTEPKPCPTCEALARTVMLDQTSHDTTPPQRTWVGLTDEEKQEWIDAMPYDPEPRHCMILVNVIEAKLKEKNT